MKIGVPQIFVSGALFMTVVILSSCGLSVPAPEELDITATSKDPSFQFNVASTYALPPNVVVIDDPNSTTATTISQSVSDFTINQVAAHFDSAGYKRILDTNGP